MSTSGYRNVDGELLLSADVTRECGHVRAVDIGPIRYLESYRRDLVGSVERCEQCPGFRPRVRYRVAEVRPYRRVTSVELFMPPS
jgi:hypothetical protein